MKTLNKIVMVAVALIAFAGTVVAQVTNGVPEGGVVAPLPQSMGEFWTLGIAALTPLIVGGIYKLMPKLPKLVLPISTPLIGILLGLAVNAMGKAELGWIDMAQAGALAVFIREVWTNAVTKQLSQPPSPTPPA